MKKITCLFLIAAGLDCAAQNEVVYIWCGALTSHSVRVNAKMTDPSADLRLLVDEDSSFSTPTASPLYSVSLSTGMVAALEMDGLAPETKYYYRISSSGIPDTSADDTGSFTTFGNGPYSFSFVTGSCGVNSNHPVYRVMKSLDPAFYLNMGDLHYANENSATNISAHRSPYQTLVLSKPAAADLFRSVPFAYVWDDHDYCGNGTDSSAAGKELARRAFHECVPHYPFAFGAGPDKPIAQAFTVGRLRFILTDLRSERDNSRMMSDAQTTWLENECLMARDNQQMIAWVSTDTWNNTTVNSDNWGKYPARRHELSDFFNANNIANMFILMGDAHLLGIDDGSHADFSSFDTFYKYPLFAAAALNNTGSYKGGIFSEGYFLNPDNTWGQFGKVDVIDNGGDSICVTFTGYRVNSTGTVVTTPLTYSFCRHLSGIGISESAVMTGIHVYPNPSSRLDIVFDEPQDITEVGIADVNGRVVYSRSIEVHHSRALSLSDVPVPDGFYIVSVSTSGGLLRVKWIRKE